MVLIQSNVEWIFPFIDANDPPQKKKICKKYIPKYSPYSFESESCPKVWYRLSTV